MELGAFAVHFGRTGDESRAAIAVGGFEDDFGAMDGGADGSHRLIDDQLHADRGGQMKDGVALAHEDVDGGVILDRAANKLEIGGG